MTEPKWILGRVVLAIHQMLLAEHGGSPGIRDQALLESALSRPRQRFEYAHDPTIFELAASYCYGLARNHPFVDGNKRVALTVAAVFLELNGHVLDAPETDAVVVIEKLAAGELTEEALARWLGEHSIPDA